MDVRRRIVIDALALTIAVLAFPHSAWAGPGRVQVHVSLKHACTILDIQDLHFGELDPSNLAPVRASAMITYWCTNGSPYSIDLNEGENYDGVRGARRMKHGGGRLDMLHYQIAEPTRFSGIGQGASLPETHKVRALILQADIEKMSASTYLDNITVTIEP